MYTNTPYKSAQRMYELADKAEKTEAISGARSAIIGLEEFVESLINLDPPRFDPSEASGLRDSLKALTATVEHALDMLAEERDEMATISDRIYFLEAKADRLEKARDDAQETSAKYYGDAVQAKRELHKLRMREREAVDDSGPDC